MRLTRGVGVTSSPASSKSEWTFTILCKIDNATSPTWQTKHKSAFVTHRTNSDNQQLIYYKSMCRKIEKIEGNETCT